MAEQRYRESPGSVSSLRYHVGFCPQYRHPVLAGEVAAAPPPLLREAAAGLGVTPAAEVRPDHVHPFVAAAPPTEAPRHVVERLTRRSSRVLRQRFPAVRSRLPSPWSRSSFLASVGRASAAAIRRYLAGPKGR
jgi:putative transposase